jgi:hypothetical protein
MANLPGKRACLTGRPSRLPPKTQKRPGGGPLMFKTRGDVNVFETIVSQR